MSDLDIRTRAARAGVHAPRPAQSPTVPPIHTSVTFLGAGQADIDAVLGGERPGFMYGRNGNPTIAALEDALTDLEGAPTVAFASGMAAMHAALIAAGTAPGDTVAISRDAYGTSRTLLSEVFAGFGVRPAAIDANAPDTLDEALKAEARPRVVIVEAISNPLVRVADIPALAEAAHRRNALLIVDATLASPYLIRPLELGADIVVHSATKYLSGHGDVLAGSVAAKADLAATARQAGIVTGGILGPFEAWLVLRGLRTLPLRMDRQCHNAQSIAAWLEAHKAISRVYYPGLTSHPDHELAARLLPAGRFGGMVSFEIAGAQRPEVERFLDSLRLCLPATTLGDLFTEVSYPVVSSHRRLTPEERAQAGIPDNLVRMSAGIEELADILTDLTQALESLHAR